MSVDWISGRREEEDRGIYNANEQLLFEYIPAGISSFCIEKNLVECAELSAPRLPARIRGSIDFLDEGQARGSEPQQFAAEKIQGGLGGELLESRPVCGIAAFE